MVDTDMAHDTAADGHMARRHMVTRVNVGDLLTRSAARAPNHVALIDGERRLTYRAFNDLANRTAHGLASLGYGRGAVLALMSGNSPEFLATYFACAKLGVVCVPVNLFWQRGELGYVLNHAAARGVVVEAALLDQLRPALGDSPGVLDIVVVGGDGAAVEGRRTLSFSDLGAGRPTAEPVALVEDRDPLSYLYTSGTTSAPKAVVSSHLAVYVASLGAALDAQFTSRDRVSALLPLFHTAQLNAVGTSAIAVGATLCLMRGFDAGRLLDAVASERLTVGFMLPMMVRAVLDALEAAPRDVSSLRLVIYAMAPMPAHELRRAMDRLGCEFSLMFGQTEMNPLSVYFRPEHQLSHAGAMGTPSVNVEVAILDAAGDPVAQGGSGEIAYRSPQLLSGYLHDEAATAAAFDGGWFHSGDAGHFDTDGILWFEDRFKDIIKTGGENVASIEVEKAVYAADPDVGEVAVVGLPHGRWGEAVTAVVVPRPGASIDEAALQARLREHLSAFKCPKRIVVTDAMPKTATGKVQKAKLRVSLAGTYTGV